MVPTSIAKGHYSVHNDWKNEHKKQQVEQTLKQVLIRIRMFLGLQDLDPFVRGTDPDLSFSS
jgi:hypothetical protein